MALTQEEAVMAKRDGIPVEFTFDGVIFEGIITTLVILEARAAIHGHEQENPRSFRYLGLIPWKSLSLVQNDHNPL